MTNEELEYIEKGQPLAAIAEAIDRVANCLEKLATLVEREREQGGEK